MTAKFSGWAFPVLDSLEGRILMAGDLPDLTAQIAAVNAPLELTPGSKGTVQILVANNGAASAQGKINVQLFLSGAEDTLVGQLTGVTLSLAPGDAAKALTIPFTVTADTQAGLFHFKAVVDSGSVIAESDETNNAAVWADESTVSWKFGTLNGKNVSLTVLDANGIPVTYRLSGGGWGEIVAANPNTQLVLSDTTAKSALTITTPKGTRTTLAGLAVSGEIKGVNATTTNLDGQMVFDAGLGTITLSGVTGGSTITIGQSVNPATKVAMKFDRINDLVIDSSTPIKSITATEWLDTEGAFDSISAPSLGTLTVRGDSRRGIAGNFEASIVLGDMMLPSRINDQGDVAGSWQGLNMLPHAFARINGQIVDIGALGGEYSTGVAISNNGAVVGQADTNDTNTDGSPIGHAFFWKNGTIIDLGTLGGDNSIAYDVNDNGWVVGESQTSQTDANGSQASHGYVYHDGQMVDLGTLGGTISEASAINEAGVVVGRSQTAIAQQGGFSYPQHAFIWTGGQLADMGTLGGAQSWALDVNNQNEAAGWADTGQTDSHGNGISHAFYWHDGQMIDLGTLGGTNSAAFAVNDAGQVVGWSETGEINSNGDPILEVFLWKDGQMTGLGVEMVSNNGQVGSVSINNSGRVVGNSPRGSFEVVGGKMVPLNLVRTGTAIQSLGKATISGNVMNTEWRMTASAGTIAIGGTVVGWAANVQGSVKSVKVGVADGSSILATGPVGSLTAQQWTSGAIEASSVGSIKTSGNKTTALAGDLDTILDVTGDTGKVTVAGSASGSWQGNSVKSMAVNGNVTGLDMRLLAAPDPKAMALGKMTVKGKLESSSITSTGSVGTVAVGTMANSSVVAGTDHAALGDADGNGVLDMPTVSALDSAAVIKSFTITGKGAVNLANSNISAGQITKLSLGTVQCENGGTAFGISTGKLLKLSYIDGQVAYSWPNKNPAELNAPAANNDFLVLL